jgi:cardiolipin synthase
MLEDIAAAEGYVFIQSFIVEEGRLAEELAAVLRQKALEGVAVHFLFDELGSRKLSRRYRQHLQSSGIRVASYRSVMGRGYRLQLNFRNHRKLTVIDGRVAYTGGLNLADEYLGRHPRLGPWRDTHVRIRGPAVLGLQLSFAEDWHWATGEQLGLDCGKEEPAPGCQAVAVVPTGPADDVDVCQLFMLEAINSATERLWVASPYFVPGPAIAAALQSAAIRGVDVRILLPQNPDHILVYLAAFSYYEEMDRAGVSIHRYQPGFMHQKVVLIDDTMATVGTVNLDNRSFHLNFELTVLVADGGFAGQVKEMLERDFVLSKRASVQDFTQRSVPFRLAVLLCRLLAPIL